MYNMDIYKDKGNMNYEQDIGVQIPTEVFTSSSNPTKGLEGITFGDGEFINIDIKPSDVKGRDEPTIHGWVPICSYLLCLLPFIDC